jgi:2-dehydro-3-deoxyphosphogluconate aldolase/(4S)-4-hydroxy-2-oxoglutarate aldolase
MARHNRLKVLCAMKEIGLVPVYYNPDADTAWKITCACADGGAMLGEFTNRGDRAVNVFNKLTELRDTHRPEIILGVGSICDAPTAAMYINAGADFVVGPLLDEVQPSVQLPHRCRICPAVASATEIHRAEMLGVEICNVFPGKKSAARLSSRRQGAFSVDGNYAHRRCGPHP